MTVVFSLVRSIVFDIFRFLSSVYKDSMFLFPTVLVLENTKIHISLMNSSNVAFYIEATVNKIFGCLYILGVPDVNLNNCYI